MENWNGAGEEKLDVEVGELSDDDERKQKEENNLQILSEAAFLENRRTMQRKMYEKGFETPLSVWDDVQDRLVSTDRTFPAGTCNVPLKDCGLFVTEHEMQCLEGTRDIDMWSYGYEVPQRSSHSLQEFLEVMGYSADNGEHWSAAGGTDGDLSTLTSVRVYYARNFPMREYRIFHNRWRLYISQREMNQYRRYIEGKLEVDRAAQEARKQTAEGHDEEAKKRKGRSSSPSPIRASTSPSHSRGPSPTTSPGSSPNSSPSRGRGGLHTSFGSATTHTVVSSTDPKIRFIKTPLNLEDIKQHRTWKQTDTNGKFSLEQVTPNSHYQITMQFKAANLIPKDAKAADTWMKWDFSKFYHELLGCLQNTTSFGKAVALKYVKRDLDNVRCCLDVKDFADLKPSSHLRRLSCVHYSM